MLGKGTECETRAGVESMDGNLEASVSLHPDVWGSKALEEQGSLRLVALLMMTMMLIMAIFLRYFLICYLALCVEISRVVYVLLLLSIPTKILLSFPVSATRVMCSACIFNHML